MQIGVLGPLVLSGAHGPGPIGAPRVRRLLARLCVDAGRAVDRADLIDALWPGGDLPRRPDKSLQDTVSDLRRILHATGDGFEIETRVDLPAYALRLPIAVVGATFGGDSALGGDRAGGDRAASQDAIDALGAQRLAASADAALERSDLALAESIADSALALFRGRPYEEFETCEFAQAEIVRLEALFWDLTEVRCVAVASRADRRVLLDLPLLVRQQPLRWRLWAAWITTLGRLGRDAEALQVFTSARHELIELGLDPPAGLIELERQVLLQHHDVGSGVLFDEARRVRTSSVVRSVTPSMPAALDRPHRLTMVGREAESNLLRQRWELAERGCNEAVLVTGEPGIGKTRLISDLAEHVQGVGGVVLAGTCREALGSPFQPFAELAPGWFTSISVPQIEPAGPPEFGPAFDSFVEWLADHSQDRPVLLVVEDIQWASSSTAVLLTGLARSPVLGGLLTVVSSRIAEIDSSHPAFALVSSFPSATRRLASLSDRPASSPFASSTDPTWTRIDLDGLTPTGIDAIAKQLAIEVEANRLHEVTAGNPFFLESILFDPEFVGSQRGEQPGERGHAPRPGLGEQAPPQAQDAVRRRLALLNATEQKVLAIASVIGRTFDLTTLEEIDEIGADRMTLLDTVEGCVRHGVIHEVNAYPGRFSFVHDIVRSVLYHDMLAARRADRHYRIAQVLERRGRVDASLLAHHLISAGPMGDLGRAGAMLVASARAALMQGAVTEAVGRLIDARGMIADEPLVQAELHLLLAKAYKAQGDIDASKAAAEIAATTARQAERSDLFVAALIEHSTYGQSSWAPDPKSLRLGDEALQWIGTTSPALRATTLARLAYHRAFWGAPGPEVESAAREAVTLADQSGDEEAQAVALRALSYAVGSVGTARERILIADRLIDLGDRTDRFDFTAYGWRTRALAGYETADREVFDAGLAVLDSIDRRGAMWILAADAGRWRGLRALGVGDWTAAAEAADQYATMIPDHLVYVVGAELQRVWLDRELGRGTLMADDIMARVHTAKRSLSRQINYGLSAMQALLLAERGDHARAEVLLGDITGQGDFGAMSPVHGFLHGLVVLAAVACHAHHFLEPSYTALEPYGSQLITTSWGEVGLGSAASLRGAAELAMDRAESALVSLQVALSVEEAAGFDALSTRTLHRLVEAAQRSDRPPQDLPRWEARASHLAESLGMIRLAPIGRFN